MAEMRDAGVEQVREETDTCMRDAFEALRVHAIFGLGSWRIVTLDEAMEMQRSLCPDLRPVLVLDRCSVDEDVLDVDIIDIRVQLLLAAAGGSLAAAEFGSYADRLYPVGDAPWSGSGGGDVGGEA